MHIRREPEEIVYDNNPDYSHKQVNARKLSASVRSLHLYKENLNSPITEDEIDFAISSTYHNGSPGLEVSLTKFIKPSKKKEFTPS